MAGTAQQTSCVLQCVPETCARAQAAQRGSQSALEAEHAQFKLALAVLGHPLVCTTSVRILYSSRLCGAWCSVFVPTSAAPMHASHFLTAPLCLCAQRLDSLPEQLAAAQAENMVLQSRVALLEQQSAADASSAGKDEDAAELTSLVSSMLQPVQHALDALAQELLVLKAAAAAPATTEAGPVAASGESPADAVTAASGRIINQGTGHADVSDTVGAGGLGAVLDAAGDSSGVQPGTGSAGNFAPAGAEPEPPALVEERGGWQTSPEGAPSNAASAAEQRSLQLALAPLHERLAAAEAALHGLAHEHSAAVGAELDALAQSVTGLEGRMAQQAAQLHALMDAQSGPQTGLSSAGESETSAMAALPGVPAQGGTQEVTGSMQAAAPGDATVPHMGVWRSHSGLQARHGSTLPTIKCLNTLSKKPAGRSWQHAFVIQNNL